MAPWDTLRASGGLWCGWSGEICEKPQLKSHRNFDIDFFLRDLSQKEYDYYYLSYANKTLWPIFHYRLDLAQFDEQAYEIYE